MPSESDEDRRARLEARTEASPTMSEADYLTRSRRSVLTGAVAALAGYVGWRWVQGQPLDNRIPAVLRDGHEFNEALWRRLHRDGALAPTFARHESSMMRVNGRHGIGDEIDLDAWSMQIVGPGGDPLGTNVLADITALPKVELTVEHKCVEGWSHVVTWGGARFSDFVELYRDRLGPDLPDYVSLSTPDEAYYVGLDLPSMLHPQTLLAYELQGEPLSQDHGAPLRLATPLKYGIKQIKRIGTIEFTNARPGDYWGDRGYDWYSHL